LLGLRYGEAIVKVEKMPMEYNNLKWYKYNATLFGISQNQNCKEKDLGL